MAEPIFIFDNRGPVGLEGLTSYKYILEGSGQVVDDFEGDTPRPYTHRRLDVAWTPDGAAQEKRS